MYARNVGTGGSVILLEFDLAGADWVVVAYESQDENMLTVVQEGLSPHPSTGSLLSGAPISFIEKEEKLIGHLTDPLEIKKRRAKLEVEPEWFLPASMSVRQMGKKANHGLNYDVGWSEFSLHTGIAVPESKKIIKRYFEQAYPGIKKWHKEIQDELASQDRTLVNALGRKVRLLGDFNDRLFKRGYAFKPQSTVFDCTRIGFVEAERRKRRGDSLYGSYELLAQVHDSVVCQFPVGDLRKLVEFAQDFGTRLLRPELEIKSRKFRIPTTLKAGWNWGEMRELSLDDPERLRAELEEMLG